MDPLADKYPGWSPYNYVKNNPLRFVDPVGLSVEDLEGEGMRVLHRSRNSSLLDGEFQDDNSGGDDKKKSSEGDVSEEGKLFIHSSGTWTDNTKLQLRLGQIVEIDVKNINILGTTIRIETSFPYNSENSMILLPQQTQIFRFDNFGNEPMSWIFNISTVSDAFIVNYIIRSTWIPGMPPNPLNNPFNLKEQK